MAKGRNDGGGLGISMVKWQRAKPGIMTVDKNGRWIVARKQRIKGEKKNCGHVMRHRFRYGNQKIDVSMKAWEARSG